MQIVESLKGPSGLLGLILVSALLATCGDSGQQDHAVQLEGRFVDGPVEGLAYKTETVSGITGPDGKFYYFVGETVEFMIGDVILGHAKGAPLVTPISLVPGSASDLNDTVGNIAQLLQSMDDDGNIENGIQITGQMRATAKGREVNFNQSAGAFNTDQSVVDFVSALTATSSAGTRSMVSRVDAQVHLRDTLSWRPPEACDRPPCLRITQMWSGQFPDVTINGFSESDNDIDAGQEGNLRSYILMAARTDNIAHFKVAVVSQGDTTNALVRLGLQISKNETIMVGRSYPIKFGIMELSIDLNRELPAGARNVGPLDFFVFAGSDGDRNGSLEKDEVTSGRGWLFRVVPEWHYTSSWNFMNAWVSNAGVAVPLARDFAKTFLTGQGPSYFPPREDVALRGAEQQWESIRAIYKAQPKIFSPSQELYPYSHKVGIDYRSYKEGVIGSYWFDESSQVATKVLSSVSLKNKIINTLIDSKREGATLPNLRTALRFDRFDEKELELSFGTVYVDATLVANVICTSGKRRLSNVALRGYLWDLYDWNYSDTNEIVEPFFTAMATVQAGAGSFGSDHGNVAGQIFEIVVLLQSALPEYEGFPLGECTPPPPSGCPSIAGVWNTSTTYAWTCHGSLSGSSFTQTRQGNQIITQQAECSPSFAAPIKRNSFVTDNTVFYARDVAESELSTPGVTSFVNEIGALGIISNGGQQIDFTEYGQVSGYIGGIPGRCSTYASSKWTR